MIIKELRCDYCGELINQPKDGVLEFICERDPESGEKRCREFYIVHQAGMSPLYKVGFGGKSCYHHHKTKGFSDLGLDMILRGCLIDVFKTICPNEIEQGDEKLLEIIERLSGFE
jgi:hypothetical protein